MSATARVWSHGKTWNVHVKSETRYYRVTGIETEAEANVSANGLIVEVEDEDERQRNRTGCGDR